MGLTPYGCTSMRSQPTFSRKSWANLPEPERTYVSSSRLSATWLATLRPRSRGVAPAMAW